jgi:hypothetical protein
LSELDKVLKGPESYTGLLKTKKRNNMPQFNNAMEVFKLLNKSNCRECNETTCLAFAGAVFTGRKSLDQCPSLDGDVIKKFGEVRQSRAIEEDMDEAVAQLKQKVIGIDLVSAAQKLGGRFVDGKLILKIMGKDFSIDSRGKLSSDIHIHPWLAVPVLNYVLNGGGMPVSGNWVPLRELKSGKSYERFFNHRCEQPLKKLADNYTDLFEDMIHLFNGKEVENHYASDISLVLHPLPLMPVLICYWKPEDGLESNLNIFFDSTAEENLNIESIYGIGAGLVIMFEKIALRHG